MPPTNGILESALYVADLDRSAQFYHELFGFPLLGQNDRMAVLHASERQVLLLFRKGTSQHLPKVPHDGDGRLHLAFAIDAAHLQPWRDWLNHNGVAVEHEQVWERGGTSLYFRDPDGHLVEVATPGVWEVY
jgi:catechol 2,3-dioxygenase-like lactoylglutathione lyase family enzyme